MPVFRETAEAVALPFRASAWKASDRLGRVLAVVPASAFLMQLVDAGLKGFGKPAFFEGFMGSVGADMAPDVHASTAQRVGELAITLGSLPYDIAEVTTNPIGDVGSMMAVIPHMGAAETIGEVAESLAGAAVAAGMTGLALNLGIPNKPVAPVRAEIQG